MGVAIRADCDPISNVVHAAKSGLSTKKDPGSRLGAFLHWAREITALGHEVRLMPPQFVKPYVKSQKNDTADAEAICEAVQPPTMRLRAVKSVDQQAVLLLHRTRDLLIRQRSSLISAIRAHFAEFGVIV